MYLVPQRGVAQHERPDIFLGGFTGRDAARVSFGVVRHGGCRFTADRPELYINVVRRRIEDPDRKIGATRSVRNARRTVGKWYRSNASNKSMSTFGFAITPAAAGFRGCVK
jgi:hypothetical protein